MIRKILYVLLVLITIDTRVLAACHGSFINPITDVCWSCIFPMSLGSVKVFDSKNPDTKNPKWPICTCGGTPPRIGLAIGYWEPIALVDVTRTPYCMVNIGGIKIPLGNENAIGAVESANSDQNHSFYYVHWYIYPLIYWLNIITDALCLDKGDFDIAYLTELDPTWGDDELAFILNPEALVFANNIAQNACAGDAIASLSQLARDELFWCAGSHGTMYPLSGNVQEHVGGVAASTLLAERMVFKMHREMLLWDSTGDISSPLDTKMCHQYPAPILPKSRYRYQMVNPIPTVGYGGCYPFGRSTALWGAGREYPIKGEDFGYLIWRKRNCCAL